MFLFTKNAHKMNKIFYEIFVAVMVVSSVLAFSSGHIWWGIFFAAYSLIYIFVLRM